MGLGKRKMEYTKAKPSDVPLCYVGSQCQEILGIVLSKAVLRFRALTGLGQCRCLSNLSRATLNLKTTFMRAKRLCLTHIVGAIQKYVQSNFEPIHPRIHRTASATA